jgi:hypothetical protein
MPETEPTLTMGGTRVLRQQRMGVAAQFERREDVGFERRAPFVIGVVHRGFHHVAPGVVDEQVQAVAEILHPVEDFLALLCIAHVRGEGAHAAAVEFVFEFVAALLQQIGITCHQQHVGAEAKQFARRGEADAGTRTGNQRHLSIQPPALPHAVSPECARARIGETASGRHR